MRFSTYRYNTETCQFERVKLSARNIFWYALGLVVVGACMLIGILLLHDLLVNSDHERRLRKENRALREHHAILSAELNDLQPVLTSLENKDRVLHKRFFGPLATPPGEKSDRASKEDFLLADAASFRKQVSQLTTTSHGLLETARVARGKLLEAATDGQGFVAGDVRIVEHADGVVALDETPEDRNRHKRGSR